MKIIVDGKEVAEGTFDRFVLSENAAYFTNAINYEYRYKIKITIDDTVPCCNPKIDAIKAARACFRIGLAEAKNLVEKGGIVSGNPFASFEWFCSKLPGVSVANELHEVIFCPKSKEE